MATTFSKFPFLSGALLQRVTEFKLLGVTLTFPLFWLKHISLLCSKTQCYRGFTIIQIKQHSSSSAHSSWLRPHLEYCNFLWDPHFTYISVSIGKIHFFICSKDWSSDYCTLFAKLSTNTFLLLPCSYLCEDSYVWQCRVLAVLESIIVLCWPMPSLHVADFYGIFLLLV